MTDKSNAISPSGYVDVNAVGQNEKPGGNNDLLNSGLKEVEEHSSGFKGPTQVYAQRSWVPIEMPERLTRSYLAYCMSYLIHHHVL